MYQATACLVLSFKVSFFSFFIPCFFGFDFVCLFVVVVFFLFLFSFSFFYLFFSFFFFCFSFIHFCCSFSTSGYVLRIPTTSGDSFARLNAVHTSMNNLKRTPEPLINSFWVKVNFYFPNLIPKM